MKQQILDSGDVGGVGVAQGTGLDLSIATISATKSLELSQEGNLTLGEPEEIKYRFNQMDYSKHLLGVLPLLVKSQQLQHRFLVISVLLEILL